MTNTLPLLTLTQENILSLLARPRCSAVYTEGRGSGWWTLSCNQRRVRGSVIAALLAAELIELKERDVVAEITEAGRGVVERALRGRWGQVKRGTAQP